MIPVCIPLEALANQAENLGATKLRRNLWRISGHGVRKALGKNPFSRSAQATRSCGSGGLRHFQAVAFEQATHIVCFDHLVLNQLLSNGLEWSAMRAQDLLGLVFKAAYQCAHFLVDEPGRVLAEVRGLRNLPPKERMVPLAIVGDRSEFVAHAPTADHAPRERGSLLKIVFSAAAGLTQDEFLCYAASQHHLDAIFQIALRKVVAFLLGQLFSGAQRT